MPAREQIEQSDEPMSRSKGTRTKEQKQEVNDTHCCICFKLRSATLLSIGLSIILILAYGYKYWLDPDSRLDAPMKFYGYVTVAGVEVIIGLIGWISVYNHIRSLIKIFSYWVMIHILIIVMVFWVSTLFDHLHFGFFIGWTAIQIILIFLLWRFKQLLKIIYGWDGDLEVESQQESIEEAKEAIKPEQNDNNQNKSSVNVSINLTMPQQQTVYQQPQQPMMQPMPMQYNNMGYNPMMQPMPPQPMYNQYGNMPPQQQQQQPQNVVSNIPNKAAVEQKEDNVRISVHENEANKTDVQQNQNVSNHVEAENVEDALKAQLSISNDTEHEMLYDTSNRRNTNDLEQQRALEGGDEGFIIHGESTRDVVSVVARQKAAFDKQRPRMNTPDPPPPPNMNGAQKDIEIIEEMKEAPVHDDDDVLHDDFLADVQPDVIKGGDTPINLYFLDPGDKITGGYNDT
eukprot:294_1